MSNNGVPIRRRDQTLYRALAECLSLCEYVSGQRLEAELIRRVTKDSTGIRGEGSRFVKPTSDVFTVVCRFAFGRSEDFSSLSKYSQALRSASQRQISPDSFVDWLKKNGGLRTLYLQARAEGRPEDRMVQTLHLNHKIDFPRTGEFTLTLRYDGRGFFDVLSPDARPKTPGRGNRGD